MRSYKNYLFRKQKMYLSAQRPVRTGYVRLLGIGIRVYRDIQRQFAKFDDLANAAAHRQGPYISFIWSQPVSGDDGCAGHIPALSKIIVDEWLYQHLVHRPAVVITGK